MTTQQLTNTADERLELLFRVSKVPGLITVSDVGYAEVLSRFSSFLPFRCWDRRTVLTL
jgi:hypothetical protein